MHVCECVFWEGKGDLEHAGFRATASSEQELLLKFELRMSVARVFKLL